MPEIGSVSVSSVPFPVRPASGGFKISGPERKIVLTVPLEDTFFGKVADTVVQYVKKGQEIYIEGRISYSKYTDREGIEKYSTDIIAYSMQMGQKGNTPSSSQSPPSDDDDDLPF